jgi:hypothetical protein
MSRVSARGTSHLRGDSGRESDGSEREFSLAAARGVTEAVRREY